MIALLAALLVGFGAPAAVAESELPESQPTPERVWEVNGIRLESGQVEKLAEDLAQRTVAAVEEKVPGLALRGEQRDRMYRIYRQVSLDVFERVVEVVDRDDLDDDAREERVRELALEGQRHSHDLLVDVLDAEQMHLYAVWEAGQLDAFKSRRLDSRRRRRRR